MTDISQLKPDVHPNEAALGLLKRRGPTADERLTSTHRLASASVFLAIAGLLLFLAAVPALQAQSASLDPREQIELLQRQVRLLEERLQNLEARQQADEALSQNPSGTRTRSEPSRQADPADEQRLVASLEPAVAVAAAGAKPQPAPPAPAAAAGTVYAPEFRGYDGGFNVETGDERFSLKVNGFTQARFTSAVPEVGGANNNFDLALGRISFSGNAFDPKVSYYLQYEATTFGNNNRVSMLDWWLGYQIAEQGKFQMGRFILPYSRQFYTHPGELLFGDLSEADYAFNLQRAVGAHYGGKAGRVSYHIVATNSIRALDAGGQQNFGGQIATQGRLEFDVLEPYGYLESSPEIPDSTQFSIGIAGAYNPIDESSFFQNVMPGDKTTNLTLDFGLRTGRVTIQGAGYYRRNNFALAALGLGNDWGYYGQIGYYLVPRQWELAARVSGVDFARSNNPAVLGDVTEFTIGLNRYLHGHHVKMNSDYSLLRRSPFEGSNLLDHRVRLQLQLLM